MNVFAGFFKNTTFIGIMVFTLVMQYVIVQFGGEFTSTTPLTQSEWLLSIGIGALSLPVAVIVKLIPTPAAAPAPVKKAYGFPVCVPFFFVGILIHSFILFADFQRDRKLQPFPLRIGGRVRSTLCQSKPQW